MKRHVVHQSINTAFGSYKSFSRTISAVFGQKKHTKFRKFRINLRQKSRDCILLSTNNYSFVCNGYKAVVNFKKLRVTHFHRLWKTLKYEYCLKFWKNAFDVLVFIMFLNLVVFMYTLRIVFLIIEQTPSKFMKCVTVNVQKQPPRGVPRKRCSENM